MIQYEKVLDASAVIHVYEYVEKMLIEQSIT
jgi:hypothetical protein